MCLFHSLDSCPKRAILSYHVGKNASLVVKKWGESWKEHVYTVQIMAGQPNPP